MALYASNYGRNLKDVQEKLRKLNSQQDALTRLCGMINADLRVYELDLSTEISAAGIDEMQACHAISYGLMAVEDHVDCLIVDTLSAGVDRILSAWDAALDTNNEPLQALQACGAGHDLFALLGAVFAARMNKVPVFGPKRLHGVLSKALARLLPDEMPIFLSIPQVFAAPDAIEPMAAVQNLQFILALGPQADTRAILPQAA